MRRLRKGYSAVAPTDRSPAVSHPMRILVVEDDPDSALTLGMLLAGPNRDVRTAPDGETALGLVDGWRPDLVLLNLVLPGVHGIEVARRLRARYPDGRPLIFAVSGLGPDVYRDHPAGDAIGLHLTKPVDPERLRSMLDVLQRECG